MEIVISGIKIQYHAIFCLVGFTLMIPFTIARTLALAFTFMMNDVRADVAHAHGHVNEFGICSTFVSERGSQFVNEFSARWNLTCAAHSLMKADHSLSTSFQGDGI